MFWKKKAEKDRPMTTTPPPAAPAPVAKPVFQYSPEMPQLLEMEIVEGDTFLEGEQDPVFNKLTLWLSEHMYAVPYVYFHVNANAVDDDFTTFKQNVLKAEVIEGIELIRKHESMAKQLDSTVVTALKQLQIQNYQSMPSAGYLFQVIKQNEQFMQLLKRENNNTITLAIRDLKITTANLVSLLTSIDAIPINFIPIIRFQNLDLTIPEIITERPQCEKYTRKLNEIQQANIDMLNKLNALTNTYTEPAEISSQQQKAAFQSLINETKKIYKSDTQSIPFEVPLPTFGDLIFHPNFICCSLVKTFVDNPTKDNYWRLINEIANQMQVKETDLQLFGAMCAHCIAPIASPSLKFDGEGAAGADQQIAGIEFLAIHDPILLLHRIKAAGATEIAGIIQKFSTSWKSIFQFVVDFTNVQLTPCVSDIRQSIIDTVLTI